MDSLLLLGNIVYKVLQKLFVIGNKKYKYQHKMAATKGKNKGIVQHDDKWIEHISQPDAPTSHRMFSSESYYRSFWEDAQNGILIVDSQGEILEANPYMVRLLESTNADVEQCNVKDILPSDSWTATDYTNFTDLLNGKRYNFSDDTLVSRANDKRKQVAVRIVVTRVPSSLSLPFQHYVIHVFELERMTDYTNFMNKREESWLDLAKTIIKDKFNTLAWLIFGVICVYWLSGSLGDVTLKVFEVFMN